MELSRILRTVGGYLWGILVGCLLFAAGLVMSRIILSGFGVSPPRMPGQAAEAIAGYYLLSGSVALAIGLAPFARRVPGTYWVRWLILAAFFFVGFGVNGSIETSVYSSTKGALLMVPVLLLPCLLLAGATASLPRPDNVVELSGSSVSRFFGGRSLGQWMWRLAVAVVSFPAVYFLFRAIASPIVIEYYRQGTAGLALPDAGVILSAEFLRGFLFLLVALPVMVALSGSKRQLAVFLGIAFFVSVAAYRVVLAYQIPNVLLVTNSFERLAGSLVYAWFLVTLLGPKEVESS